MNRRNLLGLLAALPAASLFGCRDQRLPAKGVVLALDPAFGPDETAVWSVVTDENGQMIAIHQRGVNEPFIANIDTFKIGDSGTLADRMMGAS